MGVRDPAVHSGDGLPARAAAGIFFLALAVRLLALVELRDSPWNDVLLGDARHFDEWGQRIAAGDWRGNEVFYQAPLYPYFLGGVYALFGHSPGLVRLLQCCLGALAATWIARGARSFASPRASVVAGCLAALYAPWVRYDLQIEKTSLATSLSALALLLLTTRSGERGVRWPLLAGTTLGALTLLRENAAILLLPLAWAFGRERSGRAARLATLAAGSVLVLLPVALRNHALGGGLLPTASNAGVNFYIGNGAEADGQYRPLLPGRGHADHEREDARRIAQDLSGRALSPAEVSGFWFALALEEIRDEPRHFARLLLHKLRLLAHRGEIMDAVALEVFQDEALVLRVLGLLSFGVLLPLALGGAVLAWGRRHAGVTLASAALVGLSILAFFVVGRFRLGIVPFLLPFAALAPLEGRSSPRRGLALALLVLGALLAHWPLASSGDARATSYANLASELLHRDDPAGAERWARAACERDPGSADAAFNLGAVLRRQGKLAEAVEPFEMAMRLEPAYEADCLAELGAIHALSGDPAGARELLQRALSREPSHADARRYLESLERAQRSE
jgi:tetratricopeptide (TPR) repeat protein